MKTQVSMLLAACAMGAYSVSAGFDPSWESLEKHNVPEWYENAKDGKCIYAIELAPDGKAPNCPALEAKGMKLAKSLEAKPGFPVVYMFE